MWLFSMFFVITCLNRDRPLLTSNTKSLTTKRERARDQLNDNSRAFLIVIKKKKHNFYLKDIEFNLNGTWDFSSIVFPRTQLFSLRKLGSIYSSKFKFHALNALSFELKSEVLIKSNTDFVVDIQNKKGSWATIKCDLASAVRFRKFRIFITLCL